MRILDKYKKESYSEVMHLFWLCSFLIFISSLQAAPTFLVSVSPYKFFVEKIAGDFAEVEVMVPAGSSAHTFEPNPKQMVRASKADVWFRIGEPFETKALSSLTQVNPTLEIVDLREGLSLLHGSCKEHQGCGADLHLWTSPLNGMIQAKLIAEKLSRKYPEQKERFQTNLQTFLGELKELDLYIKQQTGNVSNRVLLVSHPAYGYFCRDYNFQELSIEFEGRDPTSKQLTSLLQNVRKYKPKAIFTQPQYSDKAAILIGKETGAEIVPLDPYSEHYLQAMRQIADAIKQYN